MRSRFLPAFLFLFTLLAHADVVSVHNLRIWPAPDHTRLVFDVGGPLEHRLFTLKDPNRIVIDMDNARLQGALPTETSGPVLGGVRIGQRDGGLRIVLDLKTDVQPRSFLLKPYDQYGYRLVVDLYDAAKAHAESERPVVPPASIGSRNDKELIVAIDAGHGGEDPGASGRRYHTHEKDVVLAIARELAKLVSATPGMRAVMVRKGDYYVPLKERTKIAREANADVFISIHADSVRSRFGGRGSSVYALSDRGANSALAKALADDENAADWIGGVSLDEVDNDVGKVLGDLTKTATMSDSLALGVDMLASLRRVGPLHANAVGQAGFVVLKSPIPSVLVETAFISNPDEERKLRDKAYQRRMAEGIFRGLQRAAPRLIARRGPGTLAQPVAVAAPVAPTDVREHIVRRGETLPEIAQKYHVDVEVLRFANDVHGDTVAAGRRLRIPAGGT